MKEKKNKLRGLAGKGLILIIAVLLLCIFFSGTVKSLTTPKVRLTGVSSGRLRDTVVVTGYLHFAETEDVGMPSLPKETTLTITEVCVGSGQYVSAGDVLFIAEVTDYTDKMADLMDAYSETYIQLLNHERNAVKLSRSDERWFAAYDELIAAQENLIQIQLNLPEDADALKVAQQRIAAAEVEFAAADRMGVDATSYSYRTEHVRLQNKLEKLNEEMVTLKAIQDATIVTAPHDGYIVSLNIYEDGLYDGKKPALVMSSEDLGCVLRADISRSPRKVTTGMSAVMPTQTDATLRTKVAQIGYEKNGIAYADIAINADDFGTLGGTDNLMMSGLPITINYVAEETTMQLPISAVRVSGAEYYVYTVIESENIFGAQVLTLKKQTVTVLDESDTMVAISGLNQNAQVAYMEDRALNDGMEVMTYGSTP